MKRAQEVEPLSLIMLAAAARPYYNARRYDDAIAQANKALEFDSTFARARYWRGLSYEHLSRPADAIREFQQLSARAPLSLHLAALGHAYAVGGYREKAQQVLKQLQARSDTGYVSPFDFATLYAGLGDRSRTLEWLEKAYQRRVPYMIYLAVDPQFDDFRAEPRFRDLVRRIGLPGSS
jgi:tetratricopeptide (TPR) repeat protein